MDYNWDLSAVVRGCAATPSAAADNYLASLNNEENRIGFPSLGKPVYNGFDELNQVYARFTPQAAAMPTAMTTASGGYFTQNVPISDCGGSLVSPSSSISVQVESNRPVFQNAGNNFPVGLPAMQQITQSPRPKKKRCKKKKTVCLVRTENLTADLWAWRKYGQKPIKGSPYPRNYYRCSSAKGCSARKQVEKSNTEEDIFIVTFTGEHLHPRPTHRNSLAGSTRNKPSITNTPRSQSLSPLSGTSSSPATTPVDNKTVDGADSLDIEDVNDEENLLIPNVSIVQDLLMEFQELGKAGDNNLTPSCSAAGGGGS